MILLQIKIMYAFRIFKLVIIILILSYIIGTIWLLFSKILTKDVDDPNAKSFYAFY